MISDQHSNPLQMLKQTLFYPSKITSCPLYPLYINKTTILFNQIKIINLDDVEKKVSTIAQVETHSDDNNNDRVSVIRGDSQNGNTKIQPDYNIESYNCCKKMDRQTRKKILLHIIN